MTTDLAKADSLPRDPKTGLILPLSKSLGSQDLARHRAVIAIELEVLARKFDRFGWERDRGSPAHDRLLIDWMDALQDYPLDEIRAACRDAVRRNPDRMPNEGHVVAAILAARKIAVLKSEPDRSRIGAGSEPERVTPEAARAILAEAGFAPRRMP